MKIRSLSIQASMLQKIMLLLCISLILIPVLSAAAATQRVYQYNENGRLTVMYTATQKTTYSYDKNGNLISKQVEQGDYNSVVNPTTPTPTPAPEPTPAPTPTPTPAPEPAPDPTLVPPLTPTPTESGLPIRYTLDQVNGNYNQSGYGNFTFYGWYLDPAGIQKVEVYVDGTYLGRAAMGGSREDVYKVYPAYNNHVAGFYSNSIELTTAGSPRTKKNRKGKKEIVPGQYVYGLEVRITNKANVATSLYGTITIIRGS